MLASSIYWFSKVRRNKMPCQMHLINISVFEISFCRVVICTVISKVSKIFYNITTSSTYFYKEVFNKCATKLFLNKTKTKILYSCKSTYDAGMSETHFLLHGHHGHACRSPDAEPNFWRFSSINRPILLQFHVRYSYEVHQ